MTRDFASWDQGPNNTAMAEVLLFMPKIHVAWGGLASRLHAIGSDLPTRRKYCAPIRSISELWKTTEISESSLHLLLLREMELPRSRQDRHKHLLLHRAEYCCPTISLADGISSYCAKYRGLPVLRLLLLNRRFCKLLLLLELRSSLRRWPREVKVVK